MSVNSIPMSWLVVGFAGQAMFSGRFLVQWISSERRRKSIVPVMFWWLSLAGGLLLLSYAVLRRDPVIILGQSAGLVVYVRNLILIRRENGNTQGTAADDPEGAK
jgi:lipid-A-disaccharide synthase-like uncharacterized protein